MAGDPYKGDPGAKVAVIEFSDFQCPACRKHALETQPALDEKFVTPGKVQWVFKNLPLRMHPQAAVAAVAAVCAGQQGKFWEMHDLLFEAVDQWAVDVPEPPLEALAAQLKLDGPAFAACLNGRKALEAVLGDLYDAQGVANQTPVFIVISGGAGGVINGSVSAGQFEKTLQDALDRASAGG